MRETGHAGGKAQHLKQVHRFTAMEENGAGEAIRTPDPNLGKVVLYP